MRLPKTHTEDAEAVLINTSGGLVGGDILNWSVECSNHTRCTISTQACERVYRSSGDPASVSTVIKIGNDAVCDWLPQETILFEQASISRKFHVEMSETARLFALEAVILG